MADKAKEESKVLSEVESLKFEVVSLNNQIVQLKKTLLATQERLLNSERELLEANEAKVSAERVGFLKSIGMDKKGKISFKKAPGDRYEVSFESGVET
jgi:hypothetical protein